MKRVLLWILRGIFLLILIFVGLIALDYLFAPSWLTDKAAFSILIFAAIIHCGIGIIRIKRNNKSTVNVSGRLENGNTNKNGQKSVKKQRVPRKPALTFTLIVLLLVGLGFGGYNFFNQDTHKDVPENVIEFGEKYPEAREYVQNFTEYVDKDLDMDVTAEMAASDIPLFIQWDKRWGYRNYGANYVGVAGCGPTCLAMVACGLKNDSELNPFVVATYASNEGFYTYGEGTSWSIMTEGAKHYGLNVVTGDVSSDYILANLSSKAPMICSMSPGDFTKTGHFIVLTGIDAEGKIIVNDPNSPKNSSKHWDVDSLVSQMKSVWKYSNA
ncbi:C39 family peptidase [Butyrivibrio sp. FC2001]|uniref:C39 family peptidase n=1 Tax=Butyrivibrio sp. FC2001 TaxID=1280671 RepID=UPI000416F0EF|nr:C39 family peptidase [Butyrivibrio sp. FC2001]